MKESKAWLWYFILGIIYIALLVLLVKPGSNAGTAVKSLSNGLSDLIRTAVGGNTPAKSSSGVQTV
jgi:hypothetical protein